MVYPGLEGKGEWQIVAYIQGQSVAGRCSGADGKKHRRILLPADFGIDSSSPKSRDMGGYCLLSRSNLLETSLPDNPRGLDMIVALNGGSLPRRLHAQSASYRLLLRRLFACFWMGQRTWDGDWHHLCGNSVVTNATCKIGGLWIVTPNIA